MSFYKTFYLADPVARVYFLTTDELQEFEDEDNYVPVATVETIEQVRGHMQFKGYEEITNPNSSLVPGE